MLAEGLPGTSAGDSVEVSNHVLTEVSAEIECFDALRCLACPAQREHVGADGAARRAGMGGEF